MREPALGMPQSLVRGSCSDLGGEVLGAGEVLTLGMRLDRASRNGSVDVAASARGGFGLEGVPLPHSNSTSRMGTHVSTLHLQPTLHELSGVNGENALLKLVGRVQGRFWVPLFS